MSLGDNWIAEVRATIGRDGTIRAFDKRYYCPELLRYIGWDVLVRMPVDEGGPAQVWRGQYYLCSPNLIQDLGFASLSGAEDAVAEYRTKRTAQRQRESEERASVIRGQAEALLKLIDDRLGKARDLRRILGIVEVETLTRAIKRLARGAGLFGFEPFENAQQQSVVAADPAIEQIEAILKHLHAAFGGHLHGGVAPAADDGEPAAESGAGQSLCDAPKYGDVA